ncbi:MAG: hypothetical protein ACLFTG_16350, partial [Alphaproteobacteria bacterium]
RSARSAEGGIDIGEHPNNEVCARAGAVAPSPGPRRRQDRLNQSSCAFGKLPDGWMQRRRGEGGVMVFWVICKDAAAAGGERRFGPYESAAVAQRALVDLEQRLLGTAARGFEVVLDYV